MDHRVVAQSMDGEMLEQFIVTMQKESENPANTQEDQQAASDMLPAYEAEQARRHQS